MSWVKPVLYPIITGVVTGLVLLGGQFVIQPRIAAREHFSRATWDAKREVYARAIKLVNQKFASINNWQGPDVPLTARSTPAGDPPLRDEVNQCYAELTVYSSPAALLAFRDCFGASGPITAKRRTDLITLMREDLGLGKADLGPEDTWFVVKP